MKKLPLLGLVGFAVLRLSLLAVVPQKWELRTKEDFLRGKLEGVSVSSDGVLTLAPREEKVASPTEEFYLSVLLAADGTTYLGTGHGGKVYRLGRDGKTDLYFQAPEMDVTCLAMDKKGALFAGTSPNGKIYKITDRQKGDAFFDPAEKYIWDLEFMDSGLLWAAVGETGGVYEIGPQGEGRVIFKAEENHILCLKRTGRGEVLAGSGGNGVVYRISPEGRASVVYETAYEEVRSLDMDRDGTIYAAASGTPARSRRDELTVVPAKPETAPPAAGGATVSTTVSAVSVSGVSGAGVVESLAAPAVPARESGALYRISGDGLARTLWSSNEEMIYTLLWKPDDQRVLFGTGSKGRIYSVDKDEKVSLLVQENSEQVYQLVPLDSRIYVVSNNPCYLGQLMTEQRIQGEYRGPVVDTRTLSSWGRISWEGSADAGSSLQLQTRSGNTYEPNSTWSDWSPPYQKKEEQVLSPKARYLQIKVLFKTPTGKVTPVLDTLAVFYLQTNIAPAVTRLEYLKPNEVFLKMPEQEDVILGVEKNLPEPVSKKDDLKIVIPPKKAERKGFQTITWEASDENGD
ncbi:MAG TPA: WD40 repeat domain-containing protein, partial [Burkholderiales bacterium]|nr:WD40 repeat domain-containing protein [Burkholderiales bacterium]